MRHLSGIVTLTVVSLGLLMFLCRDFATHANADLAPVNELLVTRVQPTPKEASAQTYIAGPSMDAVKSSGGYSDELPTVEDVARILRLDKGKFTLVDEPPGQLHAIYYRADDAVGKTGFELTIHLKHTILWDRRTLKWDPDLVSNAQVLNTDIRIVRLK